MRLYRQHDMDLVGLYKTEGFKFQKQVKAALKAYVRNEAYKIVQPKNPVIKKGYVAKVTLLHIYLDNKEDADVINTLNTIRVGYKNAFLKAVVRKYLDYEPLDAYKNRNDLIFNMEEDYLEYKEDKSQKEKQETKVYKKSESPVKEQNKINSSTDKPRSEEPLNNTESENDTSTDIVEDLPFEEDETSNTGQNDINSIASAEDNVFGSDDDEMSKFLAEMNSLAH